MHSQRANRFRYLIAPLLFLLLGLPAESQPKAPASFPAGEIIPKVTCTADETQSYALYLPSGYTPEKQWPIVYAFDPAAQGRNPVQQMKDLAEKYGYILAGSNNSRNGPRRPQLEAAQAVLNDTNARFSLDMRRVYFTGFSGGARVAGMIAFLCNQCAAGVMAHGAGFPREAEQDQIYFPAFITAGEEDFNSEEVTLLSREMEASGKANRLRRFPGPHQWPPAEVWAEAFEWLELLAMKEGRKPKDEAFVRAQLAKATKRAAEMEESDPHAAYEDYRRLAREFQGLADSELFAAKAAALRESPAVREGREREDEEHRQTRTLWEELGRLIQQVRVDPMNRTEHLAELGRRADGMHARAREARNPREAMAIRRALSSASAFAAEEGMQQFLNKNYRDAITNFQAVARIQPRLPWPYVVLARAYALSKDRRSCFHFLEKAAENGMRNAEYLKSAAEFAPWREHPDFKKILERVEANAQAPAS